MITYIVTDGTELLDVIGGSETLEDAVVLAERFLSRHSDKSFCQVYSCLRQYVNSDYMWYDGQVFYHVMDVSK